MQPDFLSQATTDVTAPGQPYETRVVEVGSVDYIGFVNAPQNLRELYRNGLKFANQDFYVYQDERYTYADAWKLAAQVANRLIESGVCPGDRVGISFRNYPEWIWTFMGITSMGGIAVAMNAWWSTEEMIYGIRDSGLNTLFVDQQRFDQIRDHIDELRLNVVTVRAQEQPASTTWTEWLGDAPSDMPDVDIPEQSPATLLYTSGSTAHPKGVLSTHLAITNALMGWESGGFIGMRAFQLRTQQERQEHSEELQIDANEPEPDSDQPDQSVTPSVPSTILSVPLFHVTGLTVQMLTSFRSGRKLVGMYKWDVEEALRIIQDEQISSFNGVPTMAWELAQSPKLKNYDLTSLKSAGGGGAPMAPEQARQIDSKLAKGGQGTGWGMTETQGLATSIGGEVFNERPTSCGRAIPPLVKVRAIDDEGNHLGPGETGELCIWGVMNFQEYWKQPDATAETLRDGWVLTGDIGHLDADGYVYITDRKKDIILRGGENIGCQEVEAVLYEHPEVLECSVFGIPDERLGETVAAVVCTQEDANLSKSELQAFAQEHLAKFQVPERIWIQTERLPRTASEKIFKRGIREHILQELDRENHE
ncbi:MAG: class I adenylate-forming enzyme family protein [Gammaproteobacteria bacterium]|nr:class I adenylate-forming enzyme family protein [Gammaproteobacteria bacterium]